MTLSLSFDSNAFEIDELPVDAQKDAALDMLDDAWVEAARTGVNLEVVSHAALFKSVATLVNLYGEEGVARFMRLVSKRVQAGEFTVGRVVH